MKINTNDCDKGMKGLCCCNCKNLVEINCHPWNKTIGKGSISENLGYGCNVRYCDGPINQVNIVTFSDKIHGLCELHEKNI